LDKNLGLREGQLSPLEGLLFTINPDADDASARSFELQSAILLGVEYYAFLSGRMFNMGEFMYLLNPAE
jgi:hypothetical protein